MIQLTLVASLNHLLQEFLQYFGVKMYSTNILKTIPESTFNCITGVKVGKLSY